ncbi:hypothetical protein CR513_37723, partial [Mucuna pruriens]
MPVATPYSLFLPWKELKLQKWKSSPSSSRSRFEPPNNWSVLVSIRHPCRIHLRPWVDSNSDPVPSPIRLFVVSISIWLCTISSIFVPTPYCFQSDSLLFSLQSSFVPFLQILFHPRVISKIGSTPFLIQMKSDEELLKMF